MWCPDVQKPVWCLRFQAQIHLRQGSYINSTTAVISVISHCFELCSGSSCFSLLTLTAALGYRNPQLASQNSVGLNVDLRYYTSSLRKFVAEVGCSLLSPKILLPTDSRYELFPALEEEQDCTSKCGNILESNIIAVKDSEMPSCF